MNRKYFIGMPLSKEGSDMVRAISKDLNLTFGIKNHYASTDLQKEKYPPHITLKLPFTGLIENRDDLISFLQKFVNGRIHIPIKLSDFGHFNIGVVYWDVIQFSEDLTTLQKELCNGLENNLPWVGFNSVEPNGIPHVTVAEEDVKGRFDNIYYHVKNRYPDKRFEILNQIVLYEKATSKHTWNVAEIFPLRPSS
jgi:2'-5' RNA ligase